jgi:hypothetical protein
LFDWIDSILSLILEYNQNYLLNFIKLFYSMSAINANNANNVQLQAPVRAPALGPPVGNANANDWQNADFQIGRGYRYQESVHRRHRERGGGGGDPPGPPGYMNGFPNHRYNPTPHPCDFFTNLMNTSVLFNAIFILFFLIVISLLILLIAFGIVNTYYSYGGAFSLKGLADMFLTPFGRNNHGNGYPNGGPNGNGNSNMHSNAGDYQT